MKAEVVNINSVSGAKAAIAKSAEGYPLLGSVVYWEMENVNISKLDLVDKLSAAGIDPKKSLRDIRFKSIVNRAIKAAIKDRGDKRVRVQKAVDDEEKTVWAVFFIDLDNTGEVSLQTENKITLHKKNENVSIVGPDEREIRQYISDLGGVYRTEDFRKFVLGYMKKHCSTISVRDKGGMYFVPSTRNNAFESIVKLFDQMGINCNLHHIPVIDTAQAKKSVWKSLVGDKMKELNELTDNIEALPESDAKQYLVERRLQEFKTIKQEVGMYSDLFAITNQELADALKKVEDALIKRFK